MNLILDFKTMIAVMLFGNIFIVLLILSYRYRQEKDKSIDLFILAKILQTAGWIAFALAYFMPASVSIALGDICLLIGAAFETLATLSLIKSLGKRIKTAYLAIGILFIASILYLSFVDFNSGLRVAAVSVAVAIYIILPVFYLLKSKIPSVFQRIVAYLYMFLAATLILRAIDSVLETTKGFPSDASQSLSILSIYFTMIVGSVAFILLSKESDDRELLKAATVDDLTQSLNRRTFISQAQKSLAFFVRKKGPISFIMIDIDYFKKINDTSGHIIGDTVLYEFSKKIKEQLRPYDIFGRFGGDEFSIFLPGVDAKDSDEVAERLRRKISECKKYDDVAIELTISLGVVSIIPNEKTSIDSLYNLCDNALYRAKLNGRNRAERGHVYDLDKGSA